jgi:hypothetical protein
MRTTLKYDFWTGTAAPIVYLLITLAGCTALHRKRQQPACKKLFDMIRDEWHRDNERGVYVLSSNPQSQILTEMLQCQKCFHGLARNDVQRLFGQPDTLDRGAMIYYLREPCLRADGINANGCTYMHCDFRADTVVKFAISTTSFKH